MSATPFDCGCTCAAIASKPDFEGAKMGIRPSDKQTVSTMRWNYAFFFRRCVDRAICAANVTKW